MKKLIALLLALLMVMAMAACGAEEAPEADKDDEVTANVETDEVEEEEEEVEEVVEEDEEEVELPAFDAAIYTEAYIAAVFTPDMGFIFQEMVPPVVSEMLQEVYGDEMDTLIDEMNASSQELIDEMNAMGDWNYRVEILSEVEADEDAVAALNEEYADFDVTVEAAVSVGSEVFAILGEEEQSMTTVDLTFICVDGEWWLDLSSMGI